MLFYIVWDEGCNENRVFVQKYSDQNEDRVVTVNVKVAQQQPEFWCAFFFRSTMFVWIR